MTHEIVQGWRLRQNALHVSLRIHDRNYHDENEPCFRKYVCLFEIHILLCQTQNIIWTKPSNKSKRTHLGGCLCQSHVQQHPTSSLPALCRMDPCPTNLIKAFIYAITYKLAVSKRVFLFMAPIKNCNVSWVPPPNIYRRTYFTLFLHASCLPRSLYLVGWNKVAGMGYANKPVYLNCIPNNKFLDT